MPPCPGRMLCSQVPRTVRAVTLFYFGLLILSKRNPIKINLEGRREGREGYNTRILYFTQEDLTFTHEWNVFGPHTWRDPKGILSIFLSPALLSLFLATHLLPSLISLCRQVLCLLFSIQSPPTCSPHQNAYLGSQVYGFHSTVLTAQ